MNLNNDCCPRCCVPVSNGTFIDHPTHLYWLCPACDTYYTVSQVYYAGRFSFLLTPVSSSLNTISAAPSFSKNTSFKDLRQVIAVSSSPQELIDNL